MGFTNYSPSSSRAEAIGTAAGVATTTAAPSTATDGIDTKQHRFVNCWIKLVGGTSANFTVYLYRSAIGWIQYTDVPETTLTTANGGGVIQIEPRGADRVYVRCTSVTGPPTHSMAFYGSTY